MKIHGTNWLFFASRMRHADFLNPAKDYKALEVEALKWKN
jgi:hypothetical protein